LVSSVVHSARVNLARHHAAHHAAGQEVRWYLLVKLMLDVQCRV
jgi:hypothetical protein